MDVNNFNFPENLEELILCGNDDTIYDIDEIENLPENLKVLDLHIIYNGDLDKLRRRYPKTRIISIDDNERLKEEERRELKILFKSLLENKI